MTPLCRRHGEANGQGHPHEEQCAVQKAEEAAFTLPAIHHGCSRTSYLPGHYIYGPD